MSDVKYTIALKQIREHFAPKLMVTRPEVAMYADGGGYVPTKFWNLQRISRGLFSLSDDVAQDVSAVLNTVQPVNATAPIEEIVDTSMVSHFFTEAFVPEVNPNFVPWGNYSVVEKMVKAGKFFTLFITGSHGTGKDVMVKQACATNSRPMVRVQITRDTKEDHLIGSKTLVNGTIRYEEGPIVWAALNGAVVMLNELDCGDPNELMCLQNILEGNPFFVKSLNRMITPKDGFAVIVTANTKGRGSDSGEYIGVNLLNKAFLSRFMGTLEQMYPPVKIEKEIFRRHMSSYGLDDEKFLTRLSKLIAVVRNAYYKESIEDQIDTRKACQILYLYSITGDSEVAIDMGISQFDDTTKDAIKVLWEKIDDTEDQSES